MRDRKRRFHGLLWSHWNQLTEQKKLVAPEKKCRRTVERARLTRDLGKKPGVLKRKQCSSHPPSRERYCVIDTRSSSDVEMWLFNPINCTERHGGCRESWSLTDVFCNEILSICAKKLMHSGRTIHQSSQYVHGTTLSNFCSLCMTWDTHAMHSSISKKKLLIITKSGPFDGCRRPQSKAGTNQIRPEKIKSISQWSLAYSRTLTSCSVINDRLLNMKPSFWTK